MGMFDYIRCDSPIPETDVPPPAGAALGAFQTKDTPDQGMTLYTITADGRLTWRPYEMEIVPESERPHFGKGGIWDLIGSLRRVEQDEEEIAFHGDIYFYTSNHPDVGWWGYKARFTDGRLNAITVEEFRAPEGRDVNAEIGAKRAAE